MRLFHQMWNRTVICIYFYVSLGVGSLHWDGGLVLRVLSNAVVYLQVLVEVFWGYIVFQD